MLLKLLYQQFSFAVKLAQGNLTTKADIANFVKEADLDNKLKSLNKNVT